MAAEASTKTVADRIRSSADAALRVQQAARDAAKAPPQPEAAKPAGGAK